MKIEYTDDEYNKYRLILSPDELDMIAYGLMNYYKSGIAKLPFTVEYMVNDLQRFLDNEDFRMSQKEIDNAE